MPYVKM